MINLLYPYIVPGLLYGIATLGLAIIFRYCRFPDLTVVASITFGGIVCTCVANYLGAVAGLASGFVAGGVLGMSTSLLTTGLGIQPVLSGIITMTGSLSFSYLMAPNGQVNMNKGVSLFSATFDPQDVVLVLIVSVSMCCGLSLLLKSRWGSLMLAMTGSQQFNRIRHRYFDATFSSVTVLGNAIVGLAGAFLAHKALAGHVIDHQQFLPFGLGAIFGGNALTSWVSKWAKSKRPDDADESNQMPVRNIIFKLGDLMNSDRDDSARMLALSISYVGGCFGLVLISGIVQSDAAKHLSPLLSIRGEWRFFVTACLITAAVFWAKKDGEIDG